MEFLTTLLIVILSGTIWGWKFSWLMLMLLVCLIILLIKNKKLRFNKNNSITLVIIISIYFINIVTISRLDPISLWNVFFIIIAAFIACETINKNIFEKYYNNILFFLCITSLFFWILSQVGIEVESNVIYPGNGVFYRMNWFYIYRAQDTLMSVYVGTNIRNFGIFWEPGTFQAFINLALFFYISNKQNKIFNIKSMIYIATIVTTFSTTGYLLLIINLVYYLHIHSAKKSYKRYIYVLIAFVIAILILNTDTVTKKISYENDSFNTRLNDNLNGIKAIFQSPIFGLGYHSERYTQVLERYGIYRNSSGLLIIAQQFGIIFAIWYTYRQCRNFINWTTDKFNYIKMIYILFLLIIFSTENLNQNLIFILFVFSMKEDDTNQITEKCE